MGVQGITDQLRIGWLPFLEVSAGASCQAVTAGGIDRFAAGGLVMADF